MTERDLNEIWKRTMECDCSRCDVCNNVCPANIHIPSVVSAFLRNQFQTDDRLLESSLDCIECGACSARCPQRLDVMEMIRKIAMKQMQSIR